MSPHEQIADRFLDWCRAASGAPVFPEPVRPEPPYAPFPGHRLPLPPAPDDGRRPTFFSRLTAAAKRALAPPPAPAEPEEEEEPQPHWLGKEEGQPVEHRLILPEGHALSPEAMGQLLQSLSHAASPLTLDLIGNAERISLHLSAYAEDAGMLAEQIGAHVPDALVRVSGTALAEAWGDVLNEDERVVLDFALASPFMVPLAVPGGKADPFVGLCGALSGLKDGEAGIYQVTFAPLADPWAQAALASAMRPDGKACFDDAELLRAAKEKVSRPLYGVTLRLAARAADLARAWDILRSLAAPLRQFSREDGNELAVLRSDGYEPEDQAEDLPLRRSRRCGMVLNLDELAGFVRFPTAAVRSQKFVRLEEGTRAAPPSGPSPGGVCLGVNAHEGITSPVWLGTEDRVRHLHIVGGSGSGKTTLMFNLLRQDLESGAGFALLDPHGDIADRVLGIVPPERIRDVVLVDPGDEEHIVPFNILSAHSDFEKTLLASDLVAIFRAQSTSWGDQMNSVFGNAIRAFLESAEGGTLADLRRFLLDPEWRDRFLETVTDPDIAFYWKRGFPQLGGNKSIGPILTRLETFLSPKAIRYMVSQRENRVDFADIMDGGKILIAKLPQGRMGRENSHLVGSLLIAKLQQMAMSRQRMEAAKRRPFFVYADEFQNFICPSMAEILSGARKYSVGFVLAHQDLRQLERDREVAAAVLSNAYARAVFRVSDADARTLAEGFAHFEAKDLQSLPIGSAVCRIGRAEDDFNLAVPWIPDEGTEARRREVTESSRARHAVSRSAVEERLARMREEEEARRPTRKKTAPETAERAPEPPKSPKPPVPEPALPQPQAAAVPEPPPQEIPAVVFDAQPAKEREKPAVPTASPSPEPPAAPYSTAYGMGVGGAGHRLVVETLAKEAGRLGFRSEKEFNLPNRQRVDLVVASGFRRVAVEVAMTENTLHEVGNVRKCLAENFTEVVSVSPEPSVLRNIEAAVRAASERGELPAGSLERVRFLSPAALLERLAELAAEDERAALAKGPPPPQTKTVGGRKVAVRRTERTPEQSKIEEEGFRAIAEIISRAKSRASTAPSS